MNETFVKGERLSQNKLIQQVYQQGNSIPVRNFRIRWLFYPLAAPYPAQVLFSVPKALFPLATDRNLLKRRMREAYRKHKFLLYQSLNSTQRHLLIAITFTGREILSFEEIEEKIIRLFHRLIEENEKASG